jgi:hypothetical protein
MNKVAKKNCQQGDVLLQRIDCLPSGEAKIISKGEIVLAEGETTGHFHGLMEKDSELLEINGTRFLNLKKSSVLKHQEHKPITLDAGIWQVGIVNEYDYFSQMKRKVMD